MRWDTQSAAVHGDVGSQMLTAMQWNASNWLQVLSMCAPQCPMLSNSVNDGMVKAADLMP